MICLIRITGAGRVWTRYRRLAEGQFLSNLLLALTVALFLRELR